MKLGMIILLLMATFSVQAKVNVVYGDDNRQDLFEVTDYFYLDLARSTAGMISNSRLSYVTGEVVINGSSLESRGICSDAKFAKQITAANCSGFLVGEDLLVTAGHCVKSLSDCKRNKWVFDYGIQTEGKNNFSVSETSVFSCKEVIERSLDRNSKDDYALIRLDRKVTGRTPLKFRNQGEVQDGDPLVVIGHPTGLPTKIADGANVRSSHQGTYFVANLDTFGGNSGSAVFNSQTGVVEGILVRGETDYVYNKVKKCQEPKVCADTACRGEDVTRITNIESLMNLAQR